MLLSFITTAFDLHPAPWQVMISLALAIYAVSKIATWWPARHRLGAWRGAAYLVGWVGMNAAPFYERKALPLPTLRTTLDGAIKLILGVVILAVAANALASNPRATYPLSTMPPLVAGMAGLFGFVLIFHFGSFHLLALAWRCAGFDVRPIMNKPLAATSLTDFWSRRWNLAFRDLAHRFLFRPLVAFTGAHGAMVSVFAVSGVIHDAVISLPAGGGYGLPTLYFLLQAAGFFAQRTRTARRLGLATGLLGWLATMIVVIGPVQLLFHRAFLERVMLPLIH